MSQRRILGVVVVLALLALCFLCVSGVLGFTVLWPRERLQGPAATVTRIVSRPSPLRTLTPQATRAAPAPPPSTASPTLLAQPAPTREVTAQPPPSAPARPTLPGETPAQATSLEDKLAQEQMPPYDPVVVVSSLQGGREIPRVVHETPVAYKVGDKKRFWIGDLDLQSDYQITATLRVQGEWVQMWVDDRADVSQAALQSSANTFDTVIHPTGRHYFGSEWDPGVDGDSRLVVLNALFSGAAGYFYSANQYSQEIHPHSNEHEMFVMNVRGLSPGSAAYDAVLAHEFQHMILWNVDPNEEAWVSEGSSDLSEELSGFPASQGTINAFDDNPDLQLTDWPEDDTNIGAHYGASYLMMHYFLHRFGADNLRALAREESNGAAGFDVVLARAQPGLTFNDLFADWLVANGVDDPAWEGARYGYGRLDVDAEPVAAIRRYPYSLQSDVAQYGADYFELLPSGRARDVQLAFRGNAEVKLVPNDAASGSYQWWSNRGDSGHSTLERSLDLTGARQAALAYNLWYDIERGWDYAYVRVSQDQGRTWTLLAGQHMTDYNPIGNALGPGYTGRSGRAGDEEGAPQWVRDEIDLSAYAGKKIVLRFDYITDDAVNRPGLCLDDFELRALGWQDDVEAGEEGWRAAGFVRHDNRLAQRFVVQVVEFTPEPRLRRWVVQPGQELQEIVEGLGSATDRALLIIAAIAPVTTERATYEVEIR